MWGYRGFFKLFPEKYSLFTIMWDILKDKTFTVLCYQLLNKKKIHTYTAVFPSLFSECGHNIIYNLLPRRLFGPSPPLAFDILHDFAIIYHALKIFRARVFFYSNFNFRAIMQKKGISYNFWSNFSDFCLWIF
jgi:hypothetical protein